MGLNELHQHPVSRYGRVFVSFRVNERNIMTRGSFADSARSKTNAFLLHPFYSSFEVVHPEADVIQWWDMHLRYDDEWQTLK